jgi:hypothetical protein
LTVVWCGGKKRMSKEEQKDGKVFDQREREEQTGRGGKGVAV